MSDPHSSPQRASSSESTAPSARPVPRVPDHELVRRIGSGAYGEVWLARNAVGTHRAVKIVYRDSFKDEFPYEREYRGIQKFEPISRSHDGFVDILQIGRNEEAGHFYCVMELADALTDSEVMPPADAAPSNLSPRAPNAQPVEYAPKTLRSEIKRRGRLPFDECLPVAISLTLALGHLHRHGLIHRDIKPSNIIFVGGIPKLADIGLVSDVGEARSFVGTEGFIPPEGPNSPQADIYSLGKVLYEMCMGKDRLEFPEPFTALGQAPDSPHLEEVNTIILKACAPHPRDRYQTAEDLHVDLALLQSGQSVKSKRMLERRLAVARQAAVFASLVALLILGGLLFQRHQTREAQRLLRVAEDLTARMQMRNAENLLERGNASEALSELATVLRRQPENRVAAERIMAALTQRGFPRLASKPISHPVKLYLNAHRNAAHLSPDGQKLLTIGEDFMVRLWNTQTGEEAIPAHRHTAAIYAAKFSPDGGSFLTASEDRTACVVDAATGGLNFPPLQHDRAVLDAAFSPNGRWVATASLNGTARVFDAQNGKLICGPLVHVGPMNAVAFSPDSQRLATAMEGGRIRVWHVESAQELHRFRLDGPVRILQWSPDGHWIAAAIYASHASGIWRVAIWDADSGSPMGGDLFHENRIYSLQFSPDSRRLVTTTFNNAARVWEIPTAKELMRLPHSSMVYSASFSPDGRRILTASVDRTARLWDAGTGVAISEAMVHDGRVISAEFSRDGSRVLTAGWEDKTVKLWRIPDVPAASKVVSHEHWTLFAELNPTGQAALTATGRVIATSPTINSWDYGEGLEQSVATWDVAATLPAAARPLPPGAEAITVRYTRAGPKALISNREDHDWFSATAWIWDPMEGVALGVELHHDHQITCAHLSADGLKVATGDKAGVVRVWNAKRGEPLTPPLPHAGPVKSVRFSEDGEKVVAATRGKTAVIWIVSTGTQAVDALAHDDQVWFALFSPQGDKVATTSLDYTAKIWSSAGDLIATLQHRAPVEHADFSADGKRLATASHNSVRLWDVATGNQLTEPLLHTDIVMTARFSPDGLRLITASRDATAQLWDARTGLKLADPFRHGDWVISARFSSDGLKAITASKDRTARIWDVPQASSPVALWLPELAESVSGQRLNSDRILEQVSWNDQAALRARMEAATDRSPFPEWARALLGIQDESTVRTPAPPH